MTASLKQVNHPQGINNPGARQSNPAPTPSTKAVVQGEAMSGNSDDAPKSPKIRQDNLPTYAVASRSSGVKNQTHKEVPCLEEERTRLHGRTRAKVCGNDESHRNRARGSMALDSPKDDVARASREAHQSTPAGDRTLSEKITKLESRCTKLEAEAEEYQRELLSKSRELAEAKYAMSSSRVKQQDTEKLLEVRTAELHEAQTSLGGPDPRSHSDVTRMVELLNAEVFQMAALVTDRFSFAREHSSSPFNTERLRYAKKRLSGEVGPALVNIVDTYSHEANPILVQIIVQAHFARRISWMVSAWGHFVDVAGSGVLEDVYWKIYAGESQATSARWRSLVMRYLSPVIDGQAMVVPAFNIDLTEGLVDILVLAGARLSPRTMRHQIKELFGERISSVVLQTVELRKAVGEDMLSSDFEIICPRFSHRFETEWMEDAESTDSSGGKGSRDHTGREVQVLCTTELGLGRHEKTFSDEPHAVVESNLVIKAKVVLPSMLDEFIQRSKPPVTHKTRLPTPRTATPGPKKSTQSRSSGSQRPPAKP